METSVPSIPKSYSERRAPYIGATIRLSIASALILFALLIFWDAVSSHDPDSASTAGWLMAPVVWLLISAYQKWKTVTPQDRVAADLKLPRLGCRMAAVVVALLVAGGSLGIAIPLQQTQARSKRIRVLLAQSKELGPANTENRVALRTILNRDVKTFSDFQQQCSDLRGVLDENDSLAEQRTELVTQLTSEFRGEDKVLSMLAVMQQLESEDSKVKSALRVMIGCSEALEASDARDQARFETICVAPANRTLSSAGPNETALLKQLQDKGAKLPSDLLEVLK
jgi:hypothetical protein